MSRKIFLSFLGIGRYEVTRYYFDEQKEVFYDTPFVQEALMKFLLKKEFDVNPIIFITKDAYKNWLPNANNEGLKYCLSQINSDFSSSDIEISNGKSERELLNIFLSVFENLNEGDEVFFDITHGFRSLPMLALVLLNYAKFLKGVTIRGIYYGAFDARETVDGVNWSPVWNLSYFSKIQSWASAANQFLQTGNGLMLSDLIEEEGLSNLKNGIATFTKEILVNRGPSIFSGKTQLLIQREIEVLDFQDQEPLRLILDKVKKHFSSYKKDSILNGLNAVEWCVENGLIQQGATLLEEFCTTYTLIQIQKEIYFQDSEVRSIVSAAITNSPENYRFFYTEIFPDDFPLEKMESHKRLYSIEKEIIPLIHSLNNFKKLKQLVNDIKSSVRNDINHAGYRNNPKDYDSFKKSLEKRYKHFLKIM